MGKSNSIEQQQKKNEEFQTYLSNIQKNLDDKAKKHGEEFLSKLQAYHGADYDKIIRIGAAEKYDFRQLDEVTFGNLQNVIQGTVDAIFPGSGQDKDIDEKAKEAISKVADFRGMAAAVATNLIMGAMNILATSSEITFNYSIKSESICPGLTLHILVANDSYKDSRWFHNTEIVESYVRYELVFSYSQVQTEMDIKYFNYQLAAIEKLEETVNILKGKYADALIDPDVSEEKLESMEKRIGMAEKQVSKSRDEVQKAIAAHNVNRIKRLESNGPVLGAKRAERIAAYIRSAGCAAHE